MMYLLFIGCLELLDMHSLDSVCKVPADERTSSTAKTLVSAFLDKYADLSLPSDIVDTVEKRLVRALLLVLVLEHLSLLQAINCKKMNAKITSMSNTEATILD